VEVTTNHHLEDVMRRRVFTITDLGGGDGGKGGVVHKICCSMNAHTVLKVGGAQGGHGVRNSRGQAMSFSQFGCGSFEGVRTHATRLMVLEPYGLLREARALRYEFGIPDAFDLMTVDPDCLCITPFHTFASQLQELSRKDKPKGTVGIGAGVAVLDAEAYPETAIYAKDLVASGLRNKLAAIRERMIRDLASITADLSALWPEDLETAQEIAGYLDDESLLDRVVEMFQEMGRSVQIKGAEFVQELLAQDGTVVVESSHGILNDRYYGFHPTVSRLRTTPHATWKMLEDLGYAGQVYKLGVCRAYAIRHGAGPMVTEDPTLSEHLLPGSHKDNNRWQGKVRVGPLDFVATRYAINCCGGPTAFDGLAVTWLDQIPVYGKWLTCNKYEGTSNPDLFTPEGEIRVRHGCDEEQSKRQERLGNVLGDCTPVIASHAVSRKGVDEALVGLCRAEMLEKLGIPVRMISVGPTENDKLLFPTAR
jgi:adenylosuccinate synthase